MLITVFCEPNILIHVMVKKLTRGNDTVQEVTQDITFFSSIFVILIALLFVTLFCFMVASQQTQ